MDPPGFDRLGVPVTIAGFKGCLVAPDASGEKDLLYFNFNQSGDRLFLLVLDPETGEQRQYFAPEGPGAWGYILGPDGIIYLGTWDGGLILSFDPHSPDAGIRVVGKPSESESYIWMFALGGDGRLYGGTYGNAKLVYFDPRTGEMGDLGRMHPTQMYSRTVAAGKDGRIYIGIGTAEGDVVVYDPCSGEHKSILPLGMKDVKSGSTRRGGDGHAYALLGESWYRCENSRLSPVPEYPGPPQQRFRDGRILEKAGNGFYEIRHPDGRLVRTEFSYEGTGVGIFMVSSGPLGRVYGSTMMPLELFEYDPVTGNMRDLGNPTAVNGEIYSMIVLNDLLYVCAYPGSWLSVYDPGKPWDYGTSADSNPRVIGYAGDGHLRPRAMIAVEDKVYIGSLPPYGEHGGALGVYFPREDRFVENYRHLIENQSIVTLAHDPASGLVYGGSSTSGGGGTNPIEKSAHFFAWDPAAGEKVLDVIPVEGDHSINAMTVLDGRVFFASRPSNGILCLDQGSDLPAVQGRSPGSVLDLSLGIWGNRLLGLTGSEIFEFDPEAQSCRALDAFPGGISCGFALGDAGLYFGSGAQMMSYRPSLA